MASRMPKKASLRMITVIIAILALVGIAPGCSSVSPWGTEAPDFTLPTLTGANITLSELEGTPVVLNFWTTTCFYCVQQLPYLESTAQQGAGKIEVVAVNIGQNASTVQKFLENLLGDYEPMIVALDINGQVFVNYCQVYGNPGKIPFTFFIDSEGIVTYVKIGAFRSEAELWDALNNALGITIP